MGTQSTWESQKGPCPCLNKRLISIASLFETTNLLNKQNGKGFRIKGGQEERLQRLRPLLPEADPGVQGGFRYHGRRQGRSLLSSGDIVAAFNSVGKSVSDGE